MPLRSTLALVATLMLAPAAAHASPINATAFEAPVTHDDLDLTTSDGVSRLDDRVRTRVRQMCANGGRDGASIRLEGECRQSALAATAPAMRYAVAAARLQQVRLAANTYRRIRDR